MKLLLLLSFSILASCAKTNRIRLPRVQDRVPRIVGGNDAFAGQFPFMAVIYKTTADGRYFCAGVLLDQQFILTAAQCVYEAIEFTIHLGSNQLEGTDPNRVTLATNEYIINERFDPTSEENGEPFLAHDVALIKLRIPIEYTDYIQPIVYANYGYIYPGKVVEAVGWGQVTDSNSALANDLQFVNVSFIDHNDCKNFYGESQIFNSMICAEGNYNEGICFGDIGGPLVSPHLVFNQTVTAAIGSFISQNGCESLDPTGYTRVDSYNEWISAAIRNNS